MDAVVGASQFRNEITWQRTLAKGQMTRRLPNNHAVILGYQKTMAATWNNVATLQQYDENALNNKTAAKYGIRDSDGRRYQLTALTSPSSDRPNLTYEFLGITRVWRWTKQRMQEAYDSGLVVQTRPGAVPRFKRYLDQQRGRPLADVWMDIPPINSQAKERIGYPTQKPLALLERIINASSNPGGVVLDPFCGCATACVAADRLGRKWVGIDIFPKVVGGLFHHGYVTARTDIPQRTDIEKPQPYHQNKHVLFGQQEGLCNGCKRDFPFKLYEVDHTVPQSKDGTDHIENLQILCASCNKSKSNRPQEYLEAHLTGKDVVYA